ncbi:uncharacterized protein LOC144817814 isoform X2 [Lissotriton helveticus]
MRTPSRRRIIGDKVALSRSSVVGIAGESRGETAQRPPELRPDSEHQAAVDVALGSPAPLQASGALAPPQPSAPGALVPSFPPGLGQRGLKLDGWALLRRLGYDLSPAAGPEGAASPAAGPGRSSRPGRMPRGPCWSQHEVGRLLAQIGGSRQVPLLMASTSRPNEALWRDIARRLSAEGYERSVSQCRAKWKKLKQSFYSDWAARRRGGGPSLCSPGHYKVMKGLWKAAGRPVFGVRRLPVYSLGMLEAKEEEDDEDEDEVLRPSSATLPWDMRSSVEQEGLSCPDRYPQDARTPPPPALHLVKTDFQSSLLLAGAPDFQASSSPLSYSSFPHLLTMKQESGEDELIMPAEQETTASLPEDDTSLDEQVATDLQAPAVVSLLQNMQQILAQLLQTSQQQQVLLESLASDTVTHLHLISDNLVHVGETLHELLIRVHNCDDIQ